MTRYLAQTRDPKLVKSYGCLSFAKIMAKNIGKGISKNLSRKYNQKPPDHAKQSATDSFKTASKRAIQKAAEATGDLIGNKIAVAVAKSYNGKITKVSKNSQQRNSETVTNEHDKEIPKERHISPEKRKEIIDDSRLK